jgi:actin-related protein
MGCPELFFEPSIFRGEYDVMGHSEPEKPIQTCAWSAICDADIDIRKELCKNIVLSGGSSMYKGLANRLKSEIVAKAPTGAKVRVIASFDRMNAAWKGASRLASLSTFSSSWVTADDYNEEGASVIYKKCNWRAPK